MGSNPTGGTDDDPANFPEATRADGVCVGDHTAATLAAQAASEIDRLRQRIRELEQTDK